MEENNTGELQQENHSEIVDKLKKEIDKLKANVDRLANRLLEEKTEKQLLQIMADIKNGNDPNEKPWPIERQKPNKGE
tara:strand:- start:95720 stop:95953 length:234 start_codon:yes stop_codon:yes gene_type:complete